MKYSPFFLHSLFVNQIFAEICPTNDHIVSFDVLNPINNSLVPRHFFIRLGAATLDSEFVRRNSFQFYICWSFEDYEKCDLDIFDEHKVDTRLSSAFSMNNDFSFSAKICHRIEGCLCETKLLLTCCVDESYFIQEDKKLLEEKSFRFIEWGNAMGTNSDVKTTHWRTHWHCDFSDNLFIVGIKSAALNYDRREVIRKTWLQRDYWKNMCVAFIIGETSIETIKDTLRKEQNIYQDLLLGTDQEVPVNDSYNTLIQKVLGFLFWANRYFQSISGKRLSHDIHTGVNKTRNKFPFSFAVICDDDVYINSTFINVFLRNTPTSGYYGGEVLQKRIKNHIMRPQRENLSIYYISSEMYPLNEMPLFALGNFYILSGDIVNFLIKNTNIPTVKRNRFDEHEDDDDSLQNELYLRPVGHLEDVSIGLWLMTLQVNFQIQKSLQYY